MTNQAQFRRTSLKIAAVAAACTAVALGLQGCGSSDGAPPVVLVPPPVVAAQVTTAKYSVVVRDSATGALVTDATTLTFSGAGLINSAGAVLTTATTSSGLLALATGAGTNAAATFTVKSQSRAAGWADGQAVVTVFASTNVQNIEIRVANANRAAALQASTAPVAAAAASAAATAGQLAAPLVVTTAPKTVTSITGTPVVLPPASLSVPATARLTTAAGVAATGSLTLAVVAPSLATAAGLAAVPGGVSAVKASSGPTGAPITGKLVVAGAASFTLTDGAGNRITNFSEPVIARIPVTPGTRKPTGTGLLAVGDTFPVYVRNQTTNQWDFRRVGNVVASGGGLAVEFPTNTFSEWALLYEQELGVGVVTCESRVTLTGGAGIAGPLNVVVEQAADNQLRDFAIAVPGQTVGPFTVFTSDVTGGTVRVTDSAGFVVANANFSSLCGTVSVALTAPPPPPGSMIVNFREQCPDGSNNRAFAGTVTVLTGNNTPISASGTGSVTFTGLVAGSYSVTVHPTGVANPLPATAVSVGTLASTEQVLRTLTCGAGTGGG